jgi:holo-[acyl-carrier protein] synthase
MGKKLRTGVDLVEIERFESAVKRHAAHFLDRVFTSQELGEVGDSISSLAARFAAKEAVAKALGTGIGAVNWHEVEILRGPEREPILTLHGEAARLAEELELHCWSLSLSHSQTHAIAFVVAMED